MYILDSLAVETLLRQLTRPLAFPSPHAGRVATRESQLAANSPLSGLQVNTEAAELLYKNIVDHCHLGDGEDQSQLTVLDLCCGMTSAPPCLHSPR